MAWGRGSVVCTSTLKEEMCDAKLCPEFVGSASISLELFRAKSRGRIYGKGKSPVSELTGIVSMGNPPHPNDTSAAELI